MLADSVPGPLNMELPLLRFELDEDAGVANRELRGLAGWFDRPHPTGRDLRGECDFAAEKLALALVRFGEKLEPETHAAVERFFTAFDFSSIYCSENPLASVPEFASHCIARLPGPAVSGVRENWPRAV